MEANMLSKFNQAVNENNNRISVTVNPQAQAIALSLFSNRSTSSQTLTSILETLTSSLELSGSITRHHILALLSALVCHHPDFRGQVCSIICSHFVLPSTPTRLLINALSVLFSINDGDSCVMVADESLFLSLCFRPCKASLRQWLLENAGRFSVRPSVLLTVMLGFTKDPYPHTRKAALDGLIMLCDCVEIQDLGLVEGCYSRAVELLFDSEDYIRCSAVRAVSKLGTSLVVSNHEKSEIDWSDAIFLQLCTMVRDMSMCVRVEAFGALGRVRMVFEYILLQTLSKKATPATKDKSYQGQYSGKVLNLPAAAAAFAFVHGLEDEYYEVRRSACHALRNLTVLSSKFTGLAVNYLMDVLNDDSVIVRVEVLQTMHQIALCGHLKVEEEHLHMFLGTLTDSNSLVRSAARRSLCLIKLSKLSLFRSCIEGLTRSLEVYPQDEADVFSAMFKIGQGHGKFVTSVIQEAAERMEPSLEFAFGFDEMKTSALLVLAISAPVSLEHHICTIPPRIYSYGVTMLGRISHGLADIVTPSTLLFVLTDSSRCTVVPISKFYGKEGKALHPLFLKEEETTKRLEDQIQKILVPVEMVNPCLGDDILVHDELFNCMNSILQNVKNMWALIKLGCIDEVMQTLRNWKKELQLFSYKSSKYVGALTFTLHYLDTVELLGQSWLHVVTPKNLRAYGMAESGLLLGNLSKSLIEIKTRYIGLSKEMRLNILELMVVTCTLRLIDGEACYFKDLVKILSSAISELELIHEEECYNLPNFLTGIKNQCQENNFSEEGLLNNPHLLLKALEHFSLQPCMLSGELRHKEATVCPHDNSYLKPLPFVPKLPAGIPLDVVLYNVSTEDRLWIRITIEDICTQFVFIKLEGGVDCPKQRKFTVVAPCYAIPTAKTFSLKVCIVLECTLLETNPQKHLHGPKHEVVLLCEETETPLEIVSKRPRRQMGHILAIVSSTNGCITRSTSISNAALYNGSLGNMDNPFSTSNLINHF